MPLDDYLLEFGTINVNIPCRTCQGSGRTKVREYCTICHDSVTDRLLAGEQLPNGDTMPCGHRWICCRSEDYCHDCEGSGRTMETISVRDLVGAIAREISA